MFFCGVCAGTFEGYMVHREVWATGAPKDPQIILCIGCLQARLGRQLTLRDFDFTLPINSNILLGIKLDREERQRRREDSRTPQDLLDRRRELERLAAARHKPRKR